jgi:archaellum biogenesis ATPase FlaH
MISGALGTGKSDLTTKLLGHLLSKKGENIVYITTELTPMEIEGSLLSSGVDKNALSRIRYIDGTRWSIEDYRRVSQITGVVSHLKSKNLKDINVSIQNKRVNVIINSLSTFLFRINAKNEIKYFYEKILNLKSQGSFLLFTVHDYLHPPHVYAFLESKADLVIKTDLADEDITLQKNSEIHIYSDAERKITSSLYI